MEIGKVYNTVENVGYRDSIHVPTILVQLISPKPTSDEDFTGEEAEVSFTHLEGGALVKFTDDTLTQVTLATDVVHGVIDPFVNKVGRGQFVHIFLVPGAVGKLQHSYELSLESLNKLDKKLSRTVLSDADISYLHDSCRGCYD